MTLGGFDGESDIHVMLNMYWESLEFEVPPIPGRRWFKVIDTAAPYPYDIVDAGDEIDVDGSLCSVQDRSIVVLVSK